MKFFLKQKYFVETSYICFKLIWLEITIAVLFSYDYWFMAVVLTLLNWSLGLIIFMMWNQLFRTLIKLKYTLHKDTVSFPSKKMHNSN